MTTVAVVGAGDIGGATAHALAASDCVGRVLLVDASGRAAAGKALDIQQAGAVAGFHTRLEGTDDVSRVIGCTLCVIADRFGPGSQEWLGEDALAMLARLLPHLSGAPLVFAGPSQTSLLSKVAFELQVERARLLGSSPEAFAAAARAMVAAEAACSPAEVSLAVLGVPPNGLVVAWSSATIAGHPLASVLTHVQTLRIEARVARLWPPAPYALGEAAALVSRSIVTSSRRAVSVLTALDGEFGVRRMAGILPVLVSNTGIVLRRTPSLDGRERVLVDTALGAR